MGDFHLTEKVTYNDFPMSDIEKSMNRVRLHGGLAFQKFTCSGCGNRLTIDEPFKLYTKGVCDNCPAVTDIELKGCNFIAVFPSDTANFEQVLAAVKKAAS